MRAGAAPPVDAEATTRLREITGKSRGEVEDALRAAGGDENEAANILFAA